MGVSIIEVARAADVSRMTVTRVMRGDSVRPATRQRVLDAMFALGYVPSTAARAMRSKDSLRANQARCFAMVFGGDTQKADEFFCEVTRGVEQKAAEHELCALQVHWLADLERSWQRMQSVFSIEGLCGVIMAGQFSADEIAAVQKVVSKVVVVDGPVPAGIIAGGAQSDNVGGCKLALEHLLSKGSRRVIMLGGPKDHYFTLAMESAAREFQGAFESLDMLYTDYSFEAGYEAVTKFAGNNKKFDGVFGNDTLCVGAMRAMGDMKICVPDQVRIVGFDDIPAGKYLKPALSSVSIDKQKLGSEAVRILVEMIRGDGSDMLRTVVNAELIERESS